MRLILLNIFFFSSLLSFSQIDSLNFYYQNKDYKKALRLGEKMEKDNLILNNALNLISIKANNAVMYHALGEFEIAGKKFEEALILSKNEKNITDIEIAIINKQASRNFKDLGNLSKAKKHIQEAISIFYQNKSQNNYADALRVLGDIYRAEGNPEKALPILLESSEIFKGLLGENEYYSFNLNSIGKCYLQMEDFDNAEIYLKKAIEILKKINTNSLDYALSLADLSDILIIKKQYVLAEDLLFQANEIISQNNNIPYKIALYNKLSYLYLDAKMYEDAETILKLNLELIEKVYNNNHPNTVATKNNLALLYYEKKDLELAKKIFLEILNSNESIENDKIIQTNNLALVYTELKDYKEAEKYFKLALDLIEKSNYKNNSNYLGILENLSDLYFKMDRFFLANKTLPLQIKLTKNKIIDFNQFFTEYDLLNYLSSDYERNYFPLNFLNFYPNLYLEVNIACYENELLLKNLTLRNQERIKNNILNSNDTVLKQQYEQFIANKRYLTKLEELPIAQRPLEYEQLKTDTESLEKDITRKSSEFAEAKNSLNITWKQIQEKLKPNEVVIDLVSYNYYNKKWTDSIMYGAFIIKKDSKFPKYIPLFEEKQLSVLLERNNKDHDSIQSKVINKQYSKLEISSLFLKPLEAEIKNAKTIYLTPTGVAHQINFKALLLQNNKTFGESYDVKLLGSSSQIITYKPTSIQENKNIELVLYGGIDYDKKTTETNVAPSPNDFNDLATRSGIEEFGYLGGTNIEVENIKKLATQNNYLTSIFKEKKATEESLKKLDSKANPFILHLATHGYFFENIKREKTENSGTINEMPKHNFYKESEDPMLRSGLILAGGNKFWKNTNNEIAGDDGILTAKEIANLDLSNCQLVVLSACETGLGDVNGSEGVFGLQRAFKMAGVKNIIMSLWKVPDAQTAELFELFYAECFKGKTIPEAFREAQNKMKTKYAPYYWAGFVLLE